MRGFKQFIENQTGKMQVQDAARRSGVDLTKMVQALGKMFPQHKNRITPNTIVQQPVIDKLMAGMNQQQPQQPQGDINWIG